VRAAVLQQRSARSTTIYPFFLSLEKRECRRMAVGYTAVLHGVEKNKQPAGSLKKN
jgi:hypothetical protein